jgi:general secretion pathway protein G
MTTYPNTTAGLRPSAFTLVELLLVVVILGILASVVIPQFTDASDDARTATLQTNLAILREATNRYTLQHKGRPPTLDETGSPDLAGYAQRLTGRTQPDGRIHALGSLDPT